MDCRVIRAQNPGSAGNYALVYLWIHKKTHGLMQMVGYNQQGKTLKRMQAMGMTSAFNAPTESGGADFSGMTNGRNPDDRLFIGLVAHTGFINLNEEGTQAAAATATAMRYGAAFGQEEPFVPSFRADRPFLYLIRDTKNGTILFLGRVVDPRG